MVDAGTIWDNDIAAAAKRLPFLRKAGVVWLEEPFSAGQFGVYARLARTKPQVALAGGEGAHNASMAMHMIDHAGIKYVQIDTGRVGGISAAKQVADYADKKGVQYVNHTFTSHLALSASLQPYAGIKGHDYCEFPVELSDLARDLTRTSIEPDADGRITLPSGPGLGVEINRDTVARYAQQVKIEINGKVLYESPTISLA